MPVTCSNSIAKRLYSRDVIKRRNKSVTLSNDSPPLKATAPELWIADGPVIRGKLLPYPTRMVVVRLSGDRLWVHSPVPLTEPLRDALDELGQVHFLIAPNHCHHLFMREWQMAYPMARSFGTREVIAKRGDLVFESTLDGTPNRFWGDDIDQCLFTGSSRMQEAVFLHRSSRSLIVADLIGNLPPATLTPLQRRLARLSGILAPDGRMPLEWRLSFLGRRYLASEHLRTLLSWRPVRIIMAHGEIIEHDASDFLARAFRWLKE